MYAYLLYVLVKHYRRDAIIVCVLIAVMITLSDQLASTVMKNYFQRLRPCHEEAIAARVHLVNNHCGGMYGFVSSHASNSFALLTFFALFLRRQHRRVKYVLLVWAVLVCYSRIYLGQHYPGDILGGAVLGTVLGVAFGLLKKKMLVVKER